MPQVGSDDAGFLVTVGGWVVAILVAMFTFIAQWRKGGVEETALVLGKWKELVEAHERELGGLRDEIKNLQARVAELEEVAEGRGDRIRELETELEGERNQRRQQARSFAEQLKRLGHNNPPELGTEKDDEPKGK
jgi:septal ring factor EnvC (AmiA/AmiB activator)